MTERSPPIEIDTKTCGMTITANGEYLVSASEDQVDVWRIKDARRMATMEATGALCVAVSKDGRWIAAGTKLGTLYVWSTTSYKRVFRTGKSECGIYTIDFSPDSTRVLAVEDIDVVRIRRVGLAISIPVWIMNRRPEQIFSAGMAVKSAKYHSLLGSRRIAVTTKDSVQVWDGDNDRMLTDIAIQPGPENGLLWFNNHLLVASWDKITEFDASTGSQVSEWPVPRGDENSFIALSQCQKFIAYAAKDTVTFWDTSAHTQLGSIQHPQNIRSIALSPDDEFLAIAGADGKITIMYLSRITEPDIQIDDVVLDSWKHDQLEHTVALLTAAIRQSQNISHHALASRALVRSRLQRWDVALADAQKAIDVQPSVIGYIAKSMAHLGMGERRKAYQACEIAFERFYASEGNFILLIRAIIVFVAGEHRDAISRMDDLIAKVHLNSICYVVQAYMYFLLGIFQTETSDCDTAIRSFERARDQMRRRTSRTHHVISLIFGWKFDNFDVAIEQGLCEALLGAGRTKDAVECLRQMTSKLGEGKLGQDFKERFSKSLEQLGDKAADAQRYDEAILHYSTALSLDPPFSSDIDIKRSNASRSRTQGVDDSNQVLMLDPLSPRGYEMKHAALHKAGDYENAVVAFEDMLSKMEQSPDPQIRERRGQYISPASTRDMIRRIVQRTIRHSPRVLINTTTGRLYDRAEQASAFESLPIFKELVSSMTTRIDRSRIKREVRQYFRYVMLSHKWEENEPSFQQVIHMAVYGLDQSPTHHKLQMFCKIVRDFGFDWAWSDTCCINKTDHFVLQEALVSVFKWYRGSAMTIVYLRGVRSPATLGDLMKSIWNTRAWSLQEYIAARVIRFYTEDWTPYLNLAPFNHKESPEIISEMEQATGVPAQQLIALRPGLSNIREKLCLASTRQTTMVEDAAYSLLGIFSVAIPVIYGEGHGALGRLLAHILAASGDASILAWTGQSSTFNSCLPSEITVFNGLVPSHIPPPIEDAKMKGIITTLRASVFDLDVALKLYDRLNELPTPWFAASRMKLPCIAFKLPLVSLSRTRSGRVYRAETSVLGMVEIKTRQDLSQLDSLYLVHPWLDALLGREDMQSNVFVEDDAVSEPSSPNSDDEDGSDEEIEVDASPLPKPKSHSHIAPTDIAPMDKETRALQLVARLRQPFGALLFTQRRVEYRRVAADSLITVQIQENVPLSDVLDNIRVLDVL